MVKIKFDSSGPEKLLELSKIIKREFDEAIQNMALKVIEKACKYFSITSLFYNCPNIMRRRKKDKEDPYLTLRKRLGPRVFIKGVESAADRAGREFIKTVLRSDAKKINREFTEDTK